MWIKLYNEGEEDFIVKKGDKIAQGIFIKYLKIDNDSTVSKRNGGIGSTNQEDDNNGKILYKYSNCLYFW